MTFHFQVDDLMRQELRNLKIAIDGQRQKRINKRKVKKPKAKRKKGGLKDLTKDRCIWHSPPTYYFPIFDCI